MTRRARTPRERARRRARRRGVVVGAALVVVLGGAGTAWAMTRSYGPKYRLATVERASVSQTVTSTGTISSANQAEMSFPVSGTVASVLVSTGQKVSAGELLARLDSTSLEQQVESRKAAVAQAQQTLADDEEQLSSANATTDALVIPPAGSSTSTHGAHEATLLAAEGRPSGSPTRPVSSPEPTSTAHPGGATSGSAASVSALLDQLTADQKSLDALLTSNAQMLNDLVTACTATATTQQTSFTASPVDSTGAEQISVTVPTDATDVSVTSPGATFTPSNQTWTATGLTAGADYTVTVIEKLPEVSAGCADALTSAEAAAASAHGPSAASLIAAVSSDQSRLAAAISALEHSSGSGSGSGRGSGSGSGAGAGSGTRPGSGSSGRGGGPAPTAGTGGAGQSGRGQSGSGARAGATGSAGRNGTGGNLGRSGSAGTGGTGSGGTSGTGDAGAGGIGNATRTVTPEQITADQAAVDAAGAELAVARQNVAQATLNTPIAGTVASVSISKAQQVSASSTSSSILVIGPGQKQLATTVGISDIDRVKVGERVAVTVDGVTKPLSGRVSLVGAMNTSGTSGSSTTYPVTVTLDPTDLDLYDGAAATAAISVGTARNVLTVPTSAVHALGPLHTVTVDNGGTVAVKQVTVGVQGVDRTQITSGLAAGDRVVLADINAAVPSSTTGNRGFVGGGLGGAGFGARTFTGGRGGR